MPREINKATLDLVKHFEGFSSRAYRCPAGVWTIGYGHTAGVTEGDAISLEVAERVLLADLEVAGDHVERLVHVQLGDNQFGALCSFVFNVGSHNFLESTLRELLNQGDYDAVPEQLMRWNKATVKGRKVALPGLTRRRAAEAALWLLDAPDLPRESMAQAVST